MEDEMKSMSSNDVWDLEEIPKGAKTVGCKWVYLSPAPASMASVRVCSSASAATRARPRLPVRPSGPELLAPGRGRLPRSMPRIALTSARATLGA